VLTGFINDMAKVSIKSEISNALGLFFQYLYTAMTTIAIHIQAGQLPFFDFWVIILAKVSYVMLNRWFTDDYPMTPWCLKCHASVILCYNHAVK